MTPVAKAQLVKTLAADIGFDLIGLARPDPVGRAAYYRDWLAAGYAGTMSYLGRNVHLRAEPARLLPGARSILSVGLNYRRADGYLGPSGPVAAAEPGDREPTGRIAQYARGRDYHVVLRRMLRTLIERLRERLQEPFACRLFVDTGPLLERELAAAAGLGWIGKNTCLLNPRLGSYIFLGEILTTLEIWPDEPVAEGCGSCTRCLDACPAKAFVAPFQLNASRCASYLTAEHRGVIPEELHASLGDRVLGCDVCQQVCPFNRLAPLGAHPDIQADLIPARLPLADFLRLSEADYRRMTSGSAAARIRPEMWRRNAAIALANAGAPGRAVEPSPREASREDAL
jgi:epoxyqueuosine reductase